MHARATTPPKVSASREVSSPCAASEFVQLEMDRRKKRRKLPVSRTASSHCQRPQQSRRCILDCCWPRRGCDRSGQGNLTTTIRTTPTRWTSEKIHVCECDPHCLSGCWPIGRPHRHRASRPRTKAVPSANADVRSDTAQLELQQQRTAGKRADMRKCWRRLIAH